MNNFIGNGIPDFHKTDAIAEYLHCKQWGPKQNPVPANTQKPQIPHHVETKTGNLKHFEVVKAIKKLRTNKTLGLDGTRKCFFFNFFDQNNVIL